MIHFDESIEILKNLEITGYKTKKLYSLSLFANNKAGQSNTAKLTILIRKLVGDTPTLSI